MDGTLAAAMAGTGGVGLGVSAGAATGAWCGATLALVSGMADASAVADEVGRSK
jgi:hypothetical protein